MFKLDIKINKCFSALEKGHPQNQFIKNYKEKPRERDKLEGKYIDLCFCDIK